MGLNPTWATKYPVGVMEAQDSSKVLVKVRVLNGVLIWDIDYRLGHSPFKAKDRVRFPTSLL